MTPDINNVILNVIRSKKITNQTALTKELNKLGLKIHQSTVSRHLEQLTSIKKVNGAYQVADLQNTATSVIVVKPNLIIIKSRPSYGSVIAQAIDSQTPNGVAGTVAGDDTVFVAIEKPNKIDAISETIKSIINGMPLE